MSYSKRKYSNAEPRTAKRHQPEVNNSLKFDAASTGVMSQSSLDLLCLAAKVVQDPTSRSDNQTPLGAQPPFTSNSGAGETSTSVVGSSGLNSIGDLPGVETQSVVPDYLPTPSPLLAPLPISLRSAQTYASLQSLPPLLPARPVPPATTRRKLKKPTMAFIYAIFKIASNEDYCTWIKWSKDGDRLLIESWDFLIDTLIDLGFSATERTSVMKNFYAYGFKLESDGRCPIPDNAGRVWTILHHNNFQRGRPEFLRDIKRAPAPPRQR